MNLIYKLQADAGDRLRKILARPLAETPDSQSFDNFDPWDILPSVYGSYSSDFDEMAIAVLCDIRDGTRTRTDLAAEMFREMLCRADLCDYGTSPRTCFPTQELAKELPRLIEKWTTFHKINWLDDSEESEG